MIFNLTITQFIKMLHNLSACLDKGALFAETKKIDATVLLESRLAPDQFNLLKQVQIACDTAKLGASRLTGKDAPKHDDTEKTLVEIKSRIANTIQYLETFSENDYRDSLTRHISQPRWEGKYLTGEEFVQHHMIPNFYFHITTAYSILRNNGVDVGKKDYLGKMPYKQ
jgi:uncharacterized protein